MNRTFLLGICLIILNSNAFSQDFGGFSPKISWQQINTEAVRVIYPEGLSDQATRVARLVNHMDQHNRTTIGERRKKLDLVLNNQGVIPNGYVTLMPYRSEFFTNPMQSNELGTLPWLDLLSIHEYRHALQFINFRTGITRLGYYLMGESFWAVAINLTTPNWFLEGDAVATETALTLQGRGRLPNFNQGYQSILANRDAYSYQRARNGSYRIDIPDHYRLGYLLTSYGREKYGDELWKTVLNRTARFKGIIYPFSKALDHETGLNSREFYYEAMDYYQHTWDSLQQLQPMDQSVRITPEYTRVTHDDYPVWDPKTTSWFAVRKTFSRTPAIISLDMEGNSEKITDVGFSIDQAFTLNADYLAWAEYSSDPRFSTISYSDVVLFDRASGKSIRFTHQQRYFSPALSPVNNQVLVVCSGAQGECQLEILNIDHPDEKNTLPNPERYYYTYPTWSIDGKLIYTCAREESGLVSIFEIVPETGDSRKIAGPFNHTIGRLSDQGDHLVFSASFQGRQDIYTLEKQSGQIRQLTHAPYGALNPTVHPENNTICYAGYSHTGQNLRTIELEKMGKPLKTITPLDQIPHLEKTYARIEEGNILAQPFSQTWEPKPYSPDLHGVRIHSWSPVATTASAGLLVTSDNVFSNIHLTGRYDYYFNEQSSGYGLNLLYARYFPIIGLGFSQGFRNPGSDTGDKGWERSLEATVEVPLNFSQGVYHRIISADIGIRHTVAPRILGAGDLQGGKVSLSVFALHTSAQFSRIKARQNITTPLGIAAEMSFQRSIAGESAGQFQLFLDGAVRGITPNHNLVVDFSFISESAQNRYQFVDLNTYPRGYGIPTSNWLANWQFNYHFPLFYPDFGVGGIVYFSRVRANLFLDYGIGDTYNPGMNQWGWNVFQSVGLEMISDMQLINLLPFSVGLRLTALGTTDFQNPGRSSHFEVFIPVIRL